MYILQLVLVFQLYNSYVLFLELLRLDHQASDRKSL